MRSLLAALVTGLLLSLAVVFGVQWSVVRAAIDEMTLETIAGELAQDADELFGGLSIDPAREASLALAHFDPHYLTPGSGRYFQIEVDHAEALRSPSLRRQSLPVRSVAPGERRVGQVTGPEGEVLLLSANGYALQGRQVTVAIASDLAPVRQRFDRLMARYTRASLAMFALLVLLQVGIVRLALAPLRRVQADVGRLEAGAITQLGERVPAEVLPLVREVNRLLALLSQRLQRSREALGNLAHALKAPLTVLTQLADDEHVRRHPELGAQIDEQLQVLRSRIDSELRRARVAGGRVGGAPVELPVELQTLVEALRRLYHDRALDIGCRVDPGARFRGDREDLLELCGNLLDNACKWARSRVLLTVRHDGGLRLTVADDGPGCSPDDLGRITQRGVRLDESTEGHGLGLAIASGIAASYGAELRFGRSQELGGFEARVSFPPG